MNKKFLTAFCLTLALASAGTALTACSSDDLVNQEVNNNRNEQVFNVEAKFGKAPLKVEENGVATRAVFNEVNASDGDNYYTWENNDKLEVFSGTKHLGTLTIYQGIGDKLGQFRGQLTGTVADISSELRFVYLGANAQLTTDADHTNSKVTIDLSQQTGAYADVVKNSVLWGKGSLKRVPGTTDQYTTENAPEIKMENPMGIYHFKVAAPAEMANVTGLNIYGDGIYGDVNIDLAAGTATGDTNSNNFKWSVPSNVKGTESGKTVYNIYYVLPPGTFKPTFEIIDDTWNSGYAGAGLDQTPLTSSYSKSQALIRNDKGEISRFTSGSGTYYFTNGNLQYVFGRRSATMGGATLVAKRNILSRLNDTKFSADIANTTKIADKAGHYQLAANQWDVITTRAIYYTGDGKDFTNINGTYYYTSTNESRGSDKAIDMFGWGNYKTPTTVWRGDTDFKTYLNNTHPGYDLKDYGQGISVNGQKTTMLGSKDFIEIMTRTFGNDRTNNGKLMSVSCWMDLPVGTTGDDAGTFNQSQDIGGVVVFPDGFPIDSVAKCFVNGFYSEDLGHGGRNSDLFSAWGNGAATFSGPSGGRSGNRNQIKPEMIKHFGLLFLPAAGLISVSQDNYLMATRKRHWKQTSDQFDANYLGLEWGNNGPECYTKGAVGSRGTYRNPDNGTYSGTELSTSNYWASIRLALKAN